MQQEAYEHLHIQATPPPVGVVTLQRAIVQGNEAKVFEMNSGEISTVLDLPASFAIVKVESKESAPLGSVRREIEAALHRERTQIDLSRFTRKFSAQFNLEYLGMSSQPDVFGPATINPAAAATSHDSQPQTSAARP